ncbi:MAG: hypothetical protein LBR75_03445, partial [Prevotellaceae bacterium]|nr:hypothetical protein [Prevotellaceae bacterium]
MKTKVFFRMMLALLFGAVSMSAGAQNLAAWAVPDNGGTQPTEAIASFIDDGVEVTPFTRGGGFLSTATANYSFGGNSADQSELQTAISDGDYFTMTIKAKPGYKMSITGIPTWRTGATGFSSPDNLPGATNFCEVYVQYKLNDGDFADAGSVAVTANAGTGSTPLATFLPAAQTALSNLTSATTVTLRFVVVSSQPRTFYLIRGESATATTERFVLAGTAVENTATIAQWNGYEQGTQPAGGIFLATSGTNANNGVATLTRDGAGVISNTPADLVATSRAWAEGGYWMTTFNTLGYDNLKLTSRQMGSGTGPRDFELEYSVEPDVWLPVPNAGPIVVGTSYAATTGSPAGLALPVEMNNQASVSLRWIVSSTTNISGDALSGTAGTNRLDATISGKISLPALTAMTVKWRQANINQTDKTITATINSQASGFGNLNAVETYVTTADNETTVTINGTTLDTSLLPGQAGNFVDYSGGLTNIPVVLTNSMGEVTYYLTITDDTSTSIDTIDTDEVSAKYYSITGIEVPASTKGILIKRAVLSNGQIK